MSSVTLTGALADRDSWTAEECSMAAALDVIGRRATLLLLREAFYGAHRFDEFVRRAGFTEAVTAARLRELVDAGLLERRPYQEPGQRRRDAYHLTEKGQDLLPALVALTRWGDRWARPDGGRLAFTHAGCGAAIEAEIRCANGHTVAAPDITVSPRRR
jgi:DNA-binding HxlR family transcriptional regulator